MRTILKLRIIKSSVRSFPFDLIYLVSEDQKALLPKLFPWSLCLVMSDELKLRIGDLNVHVEEAMGHRTPRERTEHRSGRKLVNVLPWSQCTFVVVPILPLTRRGLHKPEKPGFEKHRYTPYLMAPQHAGSSIPVAVTKGSIETVLKPAIDDILDDDVVLFAPDGPVRPICHKCPRALFHLQGLCHLGNATCFEELTLWAPDTSATEGADVELQEDHPDADRDSTLDPV